MMSYRHALTTPILALALLASVADARTLKIATLAPEGTAWMEQLRKGAEEVATRTEGRVEFKFYPGGVMGNDKTVLRKIRAGQLQGGAFTGGSLNEVYADTAIYGMPFLFRSYAEVDYVRERVDPILKEGLARGGMVALGISEGGFAYILSDTPIRKVDDFKGKKVWVPEGDLVSQTALEVAGVSPVPLPLADVYTGLQTGLVDTVTTTPTAAIAFQWHTKVKFLTDVPLMYLVGVVAVDQGAMEKLSPSDREVVEKVMGATLAQLDHVNREGDRNAKEALKKQGITFVAPQSKEELDRWRSIADETLARLKGRGVYSEETLGIIREHLKAYRAAHPEAGGDG